MGRTRRAPLVPPPRTQYTGKSMARGQLRKMRSEWAEPVRYRLALGPEVIDINGLLERSIRIEYTGTIQCLLCGRRTKKSFGDGLCYPCFRDAPEASPCIIRPELCEGHQGRGRDPTWEAEHHVQPHVVYLAITSGLKVGVTRSDQIPTRWIDQGAWQAIRLCETPHRQLAGQIEVALKQHVSDRTNWRAMLKSAEPGETDLEARKRELAARLPEELQAYRSENHRLVRITYPVREYPAKVRSVDLRKSSVVEGTLLGIKGQYLIFDAGRVLNVRRHSGYVVLVAS